MVAWQTGTCIGFLRDPGCGLIYADDPVDDRGSHIVFVYFRDVAPSGNRGGQDLKKGDRVQFILNASKGSEFHRVHCATGMPNANSKKGVSRFVNILPSQGKGEEGFVVFIDCNAKHPSDLERGDNKVFVLQGRIDDEWMKWCKNRSGFGDLLFFGAEWEGAADFSEWYVDGDLVLLGCRFNQRFSLKNAQVDGHIHLEGSDFSGPEGASFRGVQARGLYLDFGVKGPRDLVWLNEMRIENDVVVGGFFPSGIQVMALQDDIVPSGPAKNGKSAPCFHALYVGKEFYRSQRINRTVIEGELEIVGLCHGEKIRLDRVECRGLLVEDVGDGVSIGCRDARIGGNVVVKGAAHDDNARQNGIDFRGSYVEGHMELSSLRLSGNVDLDGATVERVIRFSDVKFVGECGLRMDRLSVGRMVFDDEVMLYGGEKPRLWRNPRFTFLERERKRNQGDAPESALIREYVMLKHLLAQEGCLNQEDQAFYNMQKYRHWRSLVARLVYCSMFGWGVRLQNIIVSGLMVIVFFVGVYECLLPDKGFPDLMLLSLQAMFMAFFGEWRPQVLVGDALTWLVTLESVTGVVYVTIFVGAYVRRLLR